MKGTILKERTALDAALRRADRLPDRSGGRLSRPLLCALASLALSAVSLGGKPLPLAACLICAAEGIAGSLCAAAGAAAGYTLFFGPDAALEPWTLCLSYLAASLLLPRAKRWTPLASGAVAAIVTAAFAWDAGVSPVGLLHAAVCTAAAAAAPLLLPPRREKREPGASKPESPDLRPLERASGALRIMYETLSRETPPVKPAELTEVYDFAAEQVCKCCMGREQCWKQYAEDTYRDLCAAGEAAMPRGEALREDFPLRFQARCSHMEGFLTAVNQALDTTLSRRRASHRLEDDRRVAAAQFRLLAGLLQSAARTAPSDPPRFRPELAVGSASAAGVGVSGDRGAACKDRFGNFFLLLCDGMGTGDEARCESDRAARLLSALLEAGAEPDSAMAVLNGFFALRSTAAFSTVDLLRVDLRSGTGCLYKWGAAPSLLKAADGVKKIGTATPPPGLDTAQSRAPGQYALSLREGETLVMVSDGAFGEETRRRLADFTGGSVRDLASCLIALGEAETADDRTVAVLRLRLPEPTKA